MKSLKRRSFLSTTEFGSIIPEEWPPQLAFGQVKRRTKRWSGRLDDGQSRQDLVPRSPIMVPCPGPHRSKLDTPVATAEASGYRTRENGRNTKGSTSCRTPINRFHSEGVVAEDKDRWLLITIRCRTKDAAEVLARRTT